MFDSGIDVYPVGESHMLPVLKKAFKEAGLIKTTAELGKACYQHRYISNEPAGIQFAGKDKIRDSFCQTWSLWFLCNFLNKKKLIRKVCRQHPTNREIWLFEDFIIPLLEKHPTWANEIIRDHKEDIFASNSISSSTEFLKALRDYSKGCKTKTCGEQKGSSVCIMNRVK